MDKTKTEMQDTEEDFMAKKIRFPLEMKNGVEVRDIEELKENFSLEQVLFYLSDGKLVTWLRDRYLDDMADAVLALNQEDADFHKKICGIFEVEYVEEQEEDMEKAMERKRKTALLKEYTDDERFYETVGQTAFDQDDLYDLLDEGETTIYLCGEKFSIPLGKRGMKYIGINHPVVVISSKEKVDFEERGIIFQDIRFDEKYSGLLSAENISYAKLESNSISDGNDETDSSERNKNYSEEVQAQIEQLVHDLNECIDDFLERTLQKYEDEDIIEDCGICLNESYYDDESYVYETKAKAKVACKEAMKDFIICTRDKYSLQKDDVKNRCGEFIENIENDIKEFIEEFMDSFNDFISLDCEGEAKTYAKEGMADVADKGSLVKQYQDLQIMQKVEDSIQELFIEPIDRELVLKEYLEVCTYDYDGNAYCYSIREAIDSIVHDVDRLFCDACEAMRKRMDEIYQFAMGNYCGGLKESLYLVYERKRCLMRSFFTKTGVDLEEKETTSEKSRGNDCDKVSENKTIQALLVTKENTKDSHAEANRLLEVLKYDTRPDSLNMNIVKFEALVKKIRCCIGEPSAFEIVGNIRDGGDAPVEAVVPMGMIFNYDDLNEYGKIIMEPEYPSYIKRKGTDDYYYPSDFLRPLDADVRRYAAVKFVEYCKGKETAYEFIFWSLLILTVDDTDKEEHLSMLFDFAEMLEISEQEVLNILQIVRMVYSKEEEEYDFDPMIGPFQDLLLKVGKRKKAKAFFLSHWVFDFADKKL